MNPFVCSTPSEECTDRLPYGALVKGRNHMTAKKVVVRRVAGAGLALVLALAVAGPVAAGKKLAADDRRQNAADDADESAGHERGPDERHAPLGRVHGQLWEPHLLCEQGRPGLHRAAGTDDVHD